MTGGQGGGEGRCECGCGCVYVLVWVCVSVCVYLYLCRTLVLGGPNRCLCLPLIACGMSNFIRDSPTAALVALNSLNPQRTERLMLQFIAHCRSSPARQDDHPVLLLHDPWSMREHDVFVTPHRSALGTAHAVWWGPPLPAIFPTPAALAAALARAHTPLAPADEPIPYIIHVSGGRVAVLLHTTATPAHVLTALLQVTRCRQLLGEGVSPDEAMHVSRVFTDRHAAAFLAQLTARGWNTTHLFVEPHHRRIAIER